MQDTVNLKCHNLLAERENYILSHPVLKREKDKIELDTIIRKGQKEKDNKR